jgi:NDP-sugar pyrophosphorylase family protein
MILAAGLGTRLRPLTLTKPKPLIELRGKPLIVYALEYMKQAGVKKIAINTHYLADQIPAVLGDNYAGIPIHYLYEPEILGTGGGLKNACDQVLGYDEPVFLMNADIFVDLDVSAFLKAHQKTDADATLLIKTVEAEKADGIGKIVRHPEPSMFCGVHIISPRALASLRAERSNPFSIIDGFYVPLVKSGAKILGFEQLGEYSDVGTLETLSRLNA